jgi:hypothetical protein
MLSPGAWSAESRRVRPVDGFVQRILREGAARSPTLHRLLVRLNASDVIVHVESGVVVSRANTAHLQFVTTADGQRYLRISINSAINPREMIVLMAHELHHALEVAAHQEVVDQTTMQRLYEQLGRRLPGRGTAFETDGSLAVSRRVRGELSIRASVHNGR